MSAFKWQLLYGPSAEEPDGLVIDEDINDSSISAAAAFPSYLNICREDEKRTVLGSIDLASCVPIFYRIKQLELLPDGRTVGTTVTVFGTYDLMTGAHELFEWESNSMSYAKCRDSFIDLAAIKVCAKQYEAFI